MHTQIQLLNRLNLKPIYHKSHLMIEPKTYDQAVNPSNKFHNKVACCIRKSNELSH
jgi:hypothetical protein